MKLLIINKKRIIKSVLCLAMLILTTSILSASLNKITPVNASERKIPIYCVKQDKKVVSISFDAAWGNEQTQTLLDILKENDVKATFFLVGNWVDKYPESVKAIADAGHDVGNHSNNHDHMTQKSLSQIADDTKACNEKIEALTGKCPTLYRPPYGDYNNDVVEGVNSCDMYCVQWDVDSLDWKDPTPEQMVERIRSKISNGSIILMHNGAKNTPEALPMIIKAIREEGYEIVPISEILLKGKYATDHEGRMYCIDSTDSSTSTDSAQISKEKEKSKTT
ncbi:MAG: polysaccharide deacetylase family protein [Clostridia bacterium]|nr:polysaccharide deacetylase family protein [Clostridia bacterium]